MKEDKPNCDKCGKRRGTTWNASVTDSIPQFEAYRSFKNLCDRCAGEVREARDSGALKVTFQKPAI